MADDSDEALEAKGISVSRDDSGKPTFSDHRDFLTKMHGALGALLGTSGQAPGGSKSQPTVDDAVEEAVKGTRGRLDDQS